MHKNGRMAKENILQRLARGLRFDETRFMTSSHLSCDVKISSVEPWTTYARTESDDRDSITTIIFVHLKVTGKARGLTDEIEIGLLTGVPPRPSEVATWIPPHSGQDHTWQS